MTTTSQERSVAVPTERTILAGDSCGETTHRTVDGQLRVLSWWQIAAIAFFVTCGGPFGIAEAIEASSPGWTLLAFIVFPCLYALPQALMTAELSTMMSENGGYIVWVDRAFGPFLSWTNAFNCAVCNVIDNAIYPVLVATYLQHSLPDLTDGQVYGVKLAVVLFGGAVNLFRIDLIGRLSSLMSVVVMLPMFLGFFWRLDMVAPSSQWFWSPMIDVSWDEFLPIMLWLHSGWDGLGSMAGEVADVGKSYPRGIGAALLFNSCAFLISCVTAFTVTTDASTADGYLAECYGRFSPWLGHWVAFGAGLSQLAVFIVVIGTTSRALWAMADRKRDMSLPAVLHWSWRRFGTPVGAVVLHTAAASVLVLVEFTRLVQISTFCNIVTLVLEFGAFIRLRYTEPDTPRPFLVPGGLRGAWLITAPKMLIVTATMFFELTDPVTRWFGLSIQAFIVGWFGLRWAWRYFRAKRRHFSALSDEQHDHPQ